MIIDRYRYKKFFSKKEKKESLSKTAAAPISIRLSEVVCVIVKLK
ncbi:hypothetical protein [Blattabacterium cuenoti]|nr:hypothetical protein [Blattabacterium cuenoti]